MAPPLKPLVGRILWLRWIETCSSCARGLFTNYWNDPRLVAFWFPLSKITVCEQSGYVDGQIVGYYEIRSADAVETVKAMALR